MSNALFDLFFVEMLTMLEERHDDSKDRSLLFHKIEEIGFRVGQSLFESNSGNVNKPTRFKEQLDVIKFICKDVWGMAFNKQIDTLRTNHKGIYLLQDNAYRGFNKMGKSPAEVEKAKLMIAFPCGIIRGGLASAGLIVAVKGELATLPACKFNLEIADA
eukprot:m.201409 g.201409  ORF g.201409 m.201409 type:complete len:160 (-) comp32796_c7_seq20:517-996(-)